MCKHVAAVLYGVGARLDQKPQLLFVLRGVDENELLAGAGQGLLPTNAPAGAQTLDQNDVAALFGIEMAEAVEPERPGLSTQQKSQKSSKKVKLRKARTTKKINSRRTRRAASGIQPTP
jgi:uncharacterized Zn finger protein